MYIKKLFFLNKRAYKNFGNIPNDVFLRKELFCHKKDNIKFCLFLTPLTHLYVSIEMS